LIVDRRNQTDGQVGIMTRKAGLNSAIAAERLGPRQRRRGTGSLSIGSTSVFPSWTVTFVRYFKQNCVL
jgi:hypothetical protein